MTVSITPLRAAGFALTAFSCWVLADTCIKIAGASELPAIEVIGVVGVVMMLVLALRGVVRHDLRSLWPRHPFRQALRSCLDVSNGVCVVIAIRHLPLALFYILIFAAPMLATLLAAALRDEPLEWRRTIAIIAGFCGVIVAVNPFSAHRAGDRAGYLACAVCATSFATNIVWSRRLAQKETPESLAFFSGLVTAAAGAAALPAHPLALTPLLGTVLAGAGLFSVVGSLCFFVALRHAGAAVVSQFHYTQLPTAALIAFVFWQEKLTLAMLAGSALIIVAGAYTASRSRAAQAAVHTGP